MIWRQRRKRIESHWNKSRIMNDDIQILALQNAHCIVICQFLNTDLWIIDKDAYIIIRDDDIIKNDRIASEIDIIKRQNEVRRIIFRNKTDVAYRSGQDIRRILQRRPKSAAIVCKDLIRIGRLNIEEL